MNYTLTATWCLRPTVGGSATLWWLFFLLFSAQTQVLSAHKHQAGAHVSQNQAHKAEKSWLSAHRQPTFQSCLWQYVFIANTSGFLHIWINKLIKCSIFFLTWKFTPSSIPPCAQWRHHKNSSKAKNPKINDGWRHFISGHFKNDYCQSSAIGVIIIDAIMHKGPWLLA